MGTIPAGRASLPYPGGRARGPGMVTKLLWEGPYTSLHFTLIFQVRLQAQRTGNCPGHTASQWRSHDQIPGPWLPAQGSLRSPPCPASHMAGAQVGIRKGFWKQGLPGTLTLSSPLAGGIDVWHKVLSQEGAYLLCNLG